MAEYVSPFGNSGATASKTNERYISSFANSPYTVDYWKKRDEEDRLRQQKQAEQAKQVQQPQPKKDDLLTTIGKGIAGLSRPVSQGGVNVFADVGKGIADSASNFVKQARISSQVKEDSADPSVVKNQTDYLNSEVKKGTISRQEADKKIADLQKKQQTRTESIKQAEQKVGAKYDPNQGALDFLDTISNVSGLGGVGKVIFKKTAEEAAKRLGRDLTEGEAKTLAEQTKKTIPETVKPEAPKPATPLAEATPNEPVKIPVPTIKTPPANAATIVPPVPHPLESTLFTAAKTQAEQRLGRELKPQELDNLTQQTKKIVAEKIGVQPATTEAAPLQTPEPLKPAGDTVSGNSLRVQQRAVEKKLTDSFGDLPQYKSINMKEQADEAVNLINTDKQKAIDIIEGKANPPGNLKAQSVHQALEEVAVQEGDGELLAKLAKSHVNTELSEGAQKLRIAAERNPHSAVEQIRQLREARKATAERRAKTTVEKEAKDIKAKVQAATPRIKKETWASFVKGLEC